MAATTTETLLELARRVRAATSASWAWISIVEGDDIVAILGDGPGHERLTGIRVPAATSLTATVAASGDDVLVLDDSFRASTDFELRRRVIRTGLGPCVMAMLRDDEGQLVGSIAVGRRTGARPFDADAPSILAAAAAEATPLVRTL